DRVVKRTISGKEMKHGVLPSYVLIAREFLYHVIFFVTSLLSMLPQLEKDLMTHGARKHILIKILKGIVELSRNAEGIQQLMNHRVIASVCPFLNSEDPDIQTCIVMVLSCCQWRYSMLKAFIRENHKVMYLLVLIICKFTENANDYTIFEFKKHDMAKSKNVLTQMSGLTSLSEWMHYSSNVSHLLF
ncbi:hypothetical protein RFI_31793, partial [Reticulomyxa filosa]